MEHSILVVIVNFNTTNRTIACLESLRPLDGLTNIYCVDNASSEDEFKALLSYVSKKKAQTPKVTLLRTETNLGFGGGINFGIRAALRNREYSACWILNNDTVVDPSSLYYLMKGQRENASAILGSVMLDSAGSSIQSVGAEFSKLFFTCKHRMSGQPLERLKCLPHYVEVDYVVGASIYCSMEHIKKLGLLEERFFLYSEDVDFSLRARKIGLSCLVASRSLIRHEESASIRAEKKIGLFSARNAFSDFY
ncbi:MAG: glycosyltransferase family 2 protein, partial [Pseudomonadota bacterium]|nr:glycosyltransferase family 2 protein [Pseudomonadota bacterium]